MYETKRRLYKNQHETTPLYVTLILCGIVYVFFVFLNMIFPTQADDLGQAAEGIRGAIRMYKTHNGRFGELMLKAFGSYYFAIKPLGAPINALFGTALLLLLFVHIFGRLPQKSYNDIAIFATLLLFFLFDPVYAFCAVFLWTAGSFNFLWGFTFILLWALPISFFWRNKLGGGYINKEESAYLLFAGSHRNYCGVVC